VFINAGTRLLCTSDGVCVIVYVKFSSVGAGTVLGGGGVFSSFWTVPLRLPTDIQSLLVVYPFCREILRLNSQAHS
jgi:hypothetical protein